MSLIEAILFDLGKVIVDFDFEDTFKHAQKKSPYSVAQIKQFFAESGLELLYDGGKISSRHFFLEVKKKLSLDMNYQEFALMWSGIFKPNKPIISLIARLSKNYRLVLLSNTNDMHWRHIKKNYSVLDYFDKHLLSYQLKLRKPDPKLYKLSAKHCKAPMNKILYIDDRKDLTDAAKALGMNVFTYRKNNHELSRYMKKLGVRA